MVFLCFVLFSLSFFVEFFLYMNKILPNLTYVYHIQYFSSICIHELCSSICSDNYVKAQEIARKAELTDTVETEYDEDNRPKRCVYSSYAKP